MQSKLQTIYTLPYEMDWWEEIRRDLVKMAQEKYTAKQLQRKLQFFNEVSTLNMMQPELFCLFELPEAKIIKLFGRIAQYILRRQTTRPHIPLFRANHSVQFRLPKKDVLLLLCLMACLLTPSQELQKYESKKNFSRQCNFSYIWSIDRVKTQPIFNYLFKNLMEQPDKIDKGFMRISRKSEHNLLTVQKLMINKSPLIPLRQYPGRTDIEKFKNSVKVDFANKYIGGGALDYGNVQEQIMFLCHPQLFVSMLICERMKSNQAIGFYGFKKYFIMNGYGDKLEYGSEQTEQFDVDEEGFVKDYIVAIDALKNPDPQYSPQIIMRELNKAYIGYSFFEEVKTVATGNWGCGVFKGDPRLKLILQWIAATLNNKEQLIYCSYENNLLKDLQSFMKTVQHLTVGQLFCIVLDYESQMKNGRRCLFNFVMKRVEEAKPNL